MSDSTRSEKPDRATLRLHAYADGELSGWARWRFERQLRRSPQLQRELAELAQVGAWVRDVHSDAPGPDLWDRIALRLPAADARRAERTAERPGLGWLAWPGAVASAVVAAVLVAQWLTPATPSRIGTVRWLDSGPRDVMVLEAAPDTTIVWVIGPPGKSSAPAQVADAGL
jgi:anti-sigma factor RsiW